MPVKPQGNWTWIKNGEVVRQGGAVGAAFRVAKAAMKGEKVMVPQDEIDRRLSICRSCEFFRELPAMKCLKCGCYLNLKTRLETEHCPIGKW